MTVRVLALWADNQSANLGVRALAAGSAEIARSAFGDSCVVDFQDFKGLESGIAFDKRNLLLDASRMGSPIRRKLAQYDLILDTGAGDSFTDIYGLRRLVAIAYVQAAARRLPCKLVLGPQTIGPFGSRLGLAVGRRSIRGADLVAARDSVSFDYAATKLSIGSRLRATDVVFALPCPADESVAKNPVRDVMLNVSGLLWNRNPHVDHQWYRDATNGLIRSLLDRELRVSILPHVIDNPYADNDVPASVEVGAAFPDVDVVVPTDLRDARRHLARSRVVVGSRMHACLNALSVGTPAIAWGYSRKFGPLFDDFDWRYAIDIRSNPDVLGETLKSVDSLLQGDGAAGMAKVRENTQLRLKTFVAALTRVVER